MYTYKRDEGDVGSERRYYLQTPAAAMSRMEYFISIVDVVGCALEE
jgi:hypothetical protein